MMSDLTVAEFPRPPPLPKYVAPAPVPDEEHQFPNEILRSKVEEVLLVQYPSIAFRQQWRWTRAYQRGLFETVSLRCEVFDSVAGEMPPDDLLEWLRTTYAPRQLERVSGYFGLRLPRRRHGGGRLLLSSGAFGDWTGIRVGDAIEYTAAKPALHRYQSPFSEVIDRVLRSDLFPFLPGDRLRVGYRTPTR
jgi:hypothetical protein